MMHYVYDGSFEGLLTVIFESYVRREFPDSIGTTETSQLTLNHLEVPADAEKARRVKEKVVTICGNRAIRMLYKCFLSEKEHCEMQIFRFVERVVREQRNILNDYRDKLIIDMQRTRKQVDREVHRMHAFVRFQETSDGKFMALIDPDFNVIPLIGNHFRKRYPGYEWIIYDIRRKTGLHYHEGTIHPLKGGTGTRMQLQPDQLSEKEREVQHLWKTYFNNVNIEERRNDRLHLQHIPKRYWPLLIEKN